MRALPRLRHSGDGPTYTRTGRLVTYLPPDILAWLTGQRVHSVPAVDPDIDLNLPLLRPEEAASLYELNQSTLASWRTRAAGPAFYRPTPRTIRYASDELITWVNAVH